MQPISQKAALDKVMGEGNHHSPEPAKVHEAVQQKRVDKSMGFGLQPTRNTKANTLTSVFTAGVDFSL